MLSDKTLQALKPREKPYKRSDQRGLYVIVRPDGAVWWRFKYRYAGREKLVSFGTYPNVSLKRAREKQDDARRLLDRQIDPSAHRQVEKEAQAHTFEAIAREWLALQKQLATATIEKARWMLEDLVFPTLGSRPIRKITPVDVLDVLRAIEARGKHETAHRTRQRIGQIFRYAVATSRADRDLTADLRGALTPTVTKNRAAITEPRRIGELLRAIDAYQGQPTVQAALKLAPLLFVRPGELRGAEWAEFDFENATGVDQPAPEWRIAAARNKMREVHVVPLPKQAVAIFEELHKITGHGRLVFPSLTSRERPISENAVTAALRRMGYTGDEMTWHGFRALASTRLNELGFLPDVIERQLQHAERNKVRAAYNRAERLDERRKMMQSWADYLDGLKADTGAKVRAIRG